MDIEIKISNNPLKLDRTFPSAPAAYHQSVSIDSNYSCQFGIIRNSPLFICRIGTFCYIEISWVGIKSVIIAGLLIICQLNISCWRISLFFWQVSCCPELHFHHAILNHFRAAQISLLAGQIATNTNNWRYFLTTLSTPHSTSYIKQEKYFKTQFWRKEDKLVEDWPYSWHFMKDIFSVTNNNLSPSEWHHATE